MPQPTDLQELRAALRQLRAQQSPAELDGQAAQLLSFRFLSEVEALTAARGLTRRALAAAVGTTPSYITQLYRGDRLLNLTMAARFERVLGVQFHVKAVAPLPAPAPPQHPAMLRKLPPMLSGKQFADAQQQTGGQAHPYRLDATAATAADILA